MPIAAVVRDKKAPMTIEEIVLRPIQEGEVLVRVAACGVCHSDLSVLNEVLPAEVPVILGHEAAGVVVEVGPGVSGLAKGDHVVALWKPGCGTCRYCKSGRSQLCKVGDDPAKAAVGRITADGKGINQFIGVGGFAEMIILSRNACVKIDPSISLEKAALLGCAVITGFGAAKYCAKVKTDDEVAVFGCGGVGLNIIQGAACCGAKTIIAIDTDPHKLEIARSFGATHTLDAKSAKLRKEVQALTVEAAGVDYAFDAVGNINVLNEAYLSLARGGEVIMVGIAHIAERFALPQTLSVLHEKGARGSVSGSHDVSSAILELIDLYKAKKLKLDELVTKTYSLRDANEAMDDLRTGKNARGVLVMG